MTTLPLRRHRCRRQAGISIVLTMLVLFTLVIVVSQVFIASEVELDQAGSQVEGARMLSIADACRLQAESTLLLDIETTGEEEGGGDEGGLGSLFGDTGSSNQGPLGGDAAEVTSTTDSMLDEWMNPSALQPPLGEDYTLLVEVVDEDRKLNLLGLWVEDEDARDEWREVMVRFFDKVYEGTRQDFSGLDAEDIIGELEQWVAGDRGRTGDWPLPPLEKTQAEKDAEEDELDTSIFEEDEGHLPLTLRELAFLESLTPVHLHGFVEDDEYYPGLEEYLTIWSHLELQDPDEEEDDPFAGSVFDGSEDEQEDAAEESGETDPDDISAEPTNDGLVNANTAPLVVLRALAPDDISTAFLEEIVEFRNMIQETREKLEHEMQQGSAFSGGIFDDDPTDDGDDTESEDDEDDPARYVFEAPGEVFTKVEEELELSVFTDDEDKNAFTSRLGVTSQVFTIKIMLRHNESGRKANFRTVVWRMETGDQPQMVTLLPLEPYHDTRRDEDYPEGYEEVSEERFL